jgi:hypothetical protein
MLTFHFKSRQTTRLNKAHDQLIEVSALLDRMKLELEARDAALEQQRRVESELRATLRHQVRFTLAT